MCVQWQGRHGYVRHRSTQHTAMQQQRKAQAVEGNLGGFCVRPRAAQKRPRRGFRAEALCRNSRLGGAVASRPAELLALGFELAAISLGLRHALWLGLRVADGLGEHLAQLSLRLRRLAREGFLLPLGHERHVGMLEGKLNPLRTAGQMFHLRFCAKAEIDLEARCWSEWPYCWV
jgi:hypothetical protein